VLDLLIGNVEATNGSMLDQGLDPVGADVTEALV
jgi:hypothetical protein